MKNILFVCLGNTCRSQMAEGFAKTLGKKLIKASSAGSAATGYLTPEVIKVMQEVGVDISRHRSRQLSRQILEKADLIVALGGSPELLYPDLREKKFINWQIPDPFGQSLSHYRQVRDKIKRKVVDLLIDLSRNSTQ